MATPHDNNHPRRALLLTGASRGIGHATVKRFSAAGWRVITCSRHPFPENCPWEAGPEDHIQVDLADPDDTLAAIAGASAIAALLSLLTTPALPMVKASVGVLHGGAGLSLSGEF